jgi:hypothetical protein
VLSIGKKLFSCKRGKKKNVPGVTVDEVDVVDLVDGKANTICMGRILWLPGNRQPRGLPLQRIVTASAPP